MNINHSYNDDEKLVVYDYYMASTDSGFTRTSVSCSSNTSDSNHDCSSNHTSRTQVKRVSESNTNMRDSDGVG